jgi:hypothetical protein
MPQILVVTDSHEETGGDVVYRERLSLSDFESDHFSGQFAERVCWAVLDADRLEQKEGEGVSV